jgi:TPR repeat protein
VLFLGLAAPVAAGPFEDGVAAHGRGDYATALQLWSPLADRGNARAQNNLGEMYRLGRGVPQDYAAALTWYRKAADQGDAIAQDALGTMYHDGRGVPQDYSEATRWYRKAADQGFAEAQIMLGNSYESGWGVPKDYVQAHKWFNLAAARYSAATEVRGMAVKNRNRVAAKMTPEQIAEAQRLAREWKPR